MSKEPESLGRRLWRLERKHFSIMDRKIEKVINKHTSNETEWHGVTRYDLIEEIKRMRRLLWLILRNGEVAITDEEQRKFPGDWELKKTPTKNGDGYVYSAKRKSESTKAERVWYE